MPDNMTLKNRMTGVDPEKVKTLRELTGEGMMDCRKALTWAEGDMERALERLRDPSSFGPRMVTKDRQTSYSKAMSLLLQIWGNWSQEDQTWFLNEDPIRMHSTLGRHLRNHTGMWQQSWTPQVHDGIDYSKEHPDAISMQAIRDFQATIKESRAKQNAEQQAG